MASRVFLYYQFPENRDVFCAKKTIIIVEMSFSSPESFREYVPVIASRKKFLMPKAFLRNRMTLKDVCDLFDYGVKVIDK